MVPCIYSTHVVPNSGMVVLYVLLEAVDRDIVPMNGDEAINLALSIILALFRQE